MFLKKYLTLVASVGLLLSWIPVSNAQPYPTKPVRLVAAGQPGGSVDFIARLLASKLSDYLGQPVIIDNRATSIVGQLVAQAAPDGYTLLVAGPFLWLSPYLQGSTTIDPVADFVPISIIARTPNILVVNPSLPVNSVKELIALGKTKPTELNYGSSGNGTMPHLAAELFQSMTGIKFVHIPYKGITPVITALIGGQLHLSFPNALAVPAHIKSGRLRALAITSPERSSIFPDLPTVAASGLPGYKAETMFGAFAPTKTSALIIQRLNREMVRALNTADVKERFVLTGSEVVASSPAQLGQAVKAEMAVLGKLIKTLGIRAD